MDWIQRNGWRIAWLALAVWASWLCRFSSIGHGYFLDRWTGLVIIHEAEYGKPFSLVSRKSIVESDDKAFEDELDKIDKERSLKK